jgi:hypothetical protein
MRRTSCTVFLLFLAFLLLTAMGGKGGGFERAPRVDKNFAVTVTDVSGNKISGEKFSWEGRVHFAGSMGMASINIPFEKIKEITVGEKKEKKVKVTAKLKDGGETVFDIEADSRCYGEASFGSFMLSMEEIKSVVLTNK